MSRWTQDPPDEDRYEAKPIKDVDVPDFDQPDPPVDPAEHAAHAIIDALATFQKTIVETDDFERLMALWKLVRRSEELCADVVNVVAAKVDQIMERRR